MSAGTTILPEEVVRVMREEGVVELEEDFAADGDLFAAGLDSMAVMQWIVVVEERWGVELGPEHVGREVMGTPERMAAFLNGRLG